MRSLIAVGAALALLLPIAAPAQYASSDQVLQGTQIRLVLLTGLTTAVAREGDPFLASVAEPVYLGNQLILPAGARVHGQVGNIERPKRFSMFRGQAAMNIYFRAIEIDGREIPAQMSILQIYSEEERQAQKRRKDIKVEEGVMVEAKRDIKKDVTAVGIGGGGGTLLGVIFSRVVRGLTIGLVGGTAYIVAKKGKEVELPAQTGMLVRLDTTVTLPSASAYDAYRNPGQ